MTDRGLSVLQLLALGFLIGCTVAPNLKTFAGQFFATADA